MSSKVTKGLLASAFLGVAIAFGATSNAQFTPPAPSNDNKSTPQKMKFADLIGTLAGIMALSEEIYIDPSRSTNYEELSATMLKAALQSLDPHSDYLTEKDLNDMRQESSGSLIGIGVELGLNGDGNAIVVAPMEDSPAQKAGLKADDIIVKVDDTIIKPKDLGSVSKKVRGTEGTSVQILIKRPGVDEPITFNIVRGKVSTMAIKTATIGNDIAYVRIGTFMKDDLNKEFRKAVLDLKTKMGGHPSSYIIDLRSNPGGRLDEAVKMTADTLGTDKVIVTSRGKNKSDYEAYAADPRSPSGIANLTEGKPIVVLVNEYSASASEIMAGALQDLAPDRVTILGQQTFGKGLVQSIIPLQGYAEKFNEMGVTVPPRGAVKLTTAQYYIPSNRSIQNIGITPNILYKPAVEKTTNGPKMREADLERGLGRPKDAAVDQTKTAAVCAPPAELKVKDGFDRILKDAEGNVYPEVLCAVDKLRGTSQWTKLTPFEPKP